MRLYKTGRLGWRARGADGWEGEDGERGVLLLTVPAATAVLRSLNTVRT